MNEFQNSDGLGGLGDYLAGQGRGGDTMLAHINPQEAEVLKALGGSGTVNPNTGLREFEPEDWAAPIIRPTNKPPEGFDPVAAGMTPYYTGGNYGGTVDEAFDPGVISGYQKDNGDGTYSNYDVEGRYQDTRVQRETPGFFEFFGDAAKDFASGPGIPILAALGAHYFLPGAGASAGAGAGAGGSTFSSIAANPGLALGNALGVTNPIAAQALGQTVINTAINGGDIEAALKNAAISAGTNFVGSNISGAVKTALVDSGLPPSVNNAITSGATSLATATLAGKDPLSALVGTEVGIAVGELANQIPGFSEMSPYQKQAATSAISGTLSGKTGAQLTNDQLNLALKAGMKAGAEALDSPQNITQDGGGTTAAMQGGFGDTADKPVTEQDLQDVLKGYTPTTDYGVDTGGYEISKAGSTEGLTVPASTHTFNDDGTIDYNIAATDAGEETGLQMPEAPSQTEMGGGYGFITPVDGGYMTSLGFVPTDHSQILGDPASFINDPNVLGKTVIGPDTIRAPLDVTPTSKAPVIPVKPAVVPPEVPTSAPSKPAAAAEAQTSQTQTSTPVSLSEIFELYDPFGESIFQASRASKTPASSLKSVYTLPPSIRAAEGGSIDDLIEYLRK